MTPPSAAASASTPRRLCLCVDDFGLSPGVNAAVFDLAEHGKITATSGMVYRSAWTAGARVLRRLPTARLDVGLHFDLTRPAAVDGPEPALPGLLARTYSRTVSASALLADIREQLNRFEDAMGRAPAFVDGHRHVHQLPVVRQLLVEEIARRYAASPPWLRGTAAAPAASTAGRLKAELIHALGGSALAALAAARGIPMSHRLLGVYDFSGDAQGYGKRLSQWLSACRTGDVLMCHPSASVLPGDPIAAARLQEYTVLQAMAWPAAGGDVALVPFSQLGQLGQPARPAA